VREGFIAVTEMTLPVLTDRELTCVSVHTDISLLMTSTAAKVRFFLFANNTSWSGDTKNTRKVNTELKMHFYTPCIYDGAAFSSPAFSVAPVVQKSK